jgi:hypothetical protein
MTVRRHKYEADILTRESAAVILRGGDSYAIARALVAIALNEPDWRWVQDECTRLSAHADANVRRLSGVCLAHIARIHQTIDRPLAKEVLRRLAEDPDPSVRGEVEAVLDDFEVFLRWKPSIRVQLEPPAI